LRKGGAAIIIKKQEAHSFITLVNLKFIEAVAIKINLYGQEYVVVVSAYKVLGTAFVS
jgi:hypothetical protein